MLRKKGLQILGNARREGGGGGGGVYLQCSGISSSMGSDISSHFYKQSILKLTYKMYHDDLPSCMTAHIVKSQPSYNLRNSLKLEIPPFKSNIKKYSIPYRGPVLWNHLLIECRNANSVKSFSRMINRDIDFFNLFCRR